MLSVKLHWCIRVVSLEARTLSAVCDEVFCSEMLSITSVHSFHVHMLIFDIINSKSCARINCLFQTKSKGLS